MKFEIHGNTYPVKEKLKAIGCRWNPDNKCWVAQNEAMAVKAREIVGGAPQSARSVIGKMVPSKAAYNAPPPTDLGPVDVQAEAAKHGRTPITGALVSFRRCGHKGESQVGQTFWGNKSGVRSRYLVVQCGAPYYMSRDYLEDCDMFSLKPGYYCEVKAVAVEPTAAEVDSDPAVAKAKALEKSKRRDDIVSAVQSAPQAQSVQLSTLSWAGMTKCWGETRMAGHETLWSDGSRLVYETSSYDDAPCAWELVNPQLAAEAITLADPQA